MNGEHAGDPGDRPGAKRRSAVDRSELQSSLCGKLKTIEQSTERRTNNQ